MQRLEFVDSLRGLAAVYVMVFHLAFVPQPNLAVPHWAEAVVTHGGTAVTLFFIISAFSLCHTMGAHGEHVGGTRAFYIRRLFRIAPLFYVMLAFFVLRDGLYAGVWHSPWEIAKNLLFIFNFLPGSQDGIVWASSTIGIEMPFYLIFPFLFAKFRSWTALLAVFFACELGAVGFHEVVLHLQLSTSAQEDYFGFSFIRNLPVFILGMLCWKVYKHYIESRTCPASLGGALILGSLWAYHALLEGSLNFLFTDIKMWKAIIYVGLLLGLGIFPSRFFVNRLTRFCGKVSYSIYLIHPSTIFFLTPVYRRIYDMPAPLTIRFLLSAAITFAIVLVLASISYRLVETPGMRLGKRLLARLGEGESNPAVQRQVT